MLSTILWGLFVVLFAALLIYSDKRKRKKNVHPSHRKKTEEQKDTERAIELEKSRRGGPHIYGGGN
ncbi:hypothetical protein V1502_11460 [Bacillus sp. SCS-153A]|uniref:hypothetical protein n=1 Tax=Rossellomorea sedimentorum TaxID=3115294 RepID=UPI0039062722